MHGWHHAWQPAGVLIPRLQRRLIYGIFFRIHQTRMQHVSPEGSAAADAAVFVLVGDRTSGWPETPGVNAMSPCAWPVLSSPRLAGINLSPELVSSLRLNCYYYCTYTFLTLWFLHGQPREHMAMARVRPSVTQQFLGC
jgi:hypothetical protein